MDHICMAARFSVPTVCCLFNFMQHSSALNGRIVLGMMIYPKWRLLGLIHANSCAKKNYNCRLSRASPNDANATNTTGGFSSHPNMPLVYRYRYFQHHGQFTSYTSLEYGWKGPIDRWFPWAQRLASELFIVGDPCDGVTIDGTCGRKGPKPMSFYVKWRVDKGF